MEIHQLRYCVRVAETLNFTRAAEDLAVAQPSLSQQIRKLERELGFAVFERGPGGVRLTSEGEAFLPYARIALARIQDTALVAQEIRGVRRGRVTIGISPIAGATLLPELVRATREHYPGVTVQTREGGLTELLHLLESGEVDLALVLLPTEDPRLTCVTLLSEDLVVVLPEKHRLTRLDAVDIAELREEPLVSLSSEYGLRQRVLEECAKGGFVPSIAFESREVGIIQRLVEAGLGVSILPAGAIRRDLAIVTRPLLAGGVRPQRAVGLAHRSDRYVPIAARRIFDLASRLLG